MSLSISPASQPPSTGISTSGTPLLDASTSGVDLNDVLVAPMSPLPADIQDRMTTESSSMVFTDYIPKHYVMCVASIALDLIDIHPLQRPLDQAHVDQLERVFGNTGPRRESEFWGSVVAADPRWNLYSHRTIDPITVHQQSGLRVQCVRANHRIHALRQWCQRNNKPDMAYWPCYVLRPGEFSSKCCQSLDKNDGMNLSRI